MKSLSRDTSEAAHRRHIENIRAMSPAQRLAAAADVSQRALAQALWVIRRRHPAIDEREARLILLGRLYGQALADRVRVWPAPGGGAHDAGNLL